MSKQRITLACWDYDRTAAIASGAVQAEGLDINFLALPVEETFFRMLRNHEFDAAEMSLSSYCVSLMKDNPEFIAIPVFPSRMFRHNSIYISTASGIQSPSDLIGRKIGVPEYQMTAPVWIRGILEDEYGVPHNGVEYFSGGAEQPGRDEKLKLNLPPSIKIAPIQSHQTLSTMLAKGEIDAMHSARAPSTYYSQPDRVRRLFEEFEHVEADYFRKTGIFPIMHTIVVRRALYQQGPWIAQSLYKAFVQSQQITYNSMREMAALKTMLPWLPKHLAQVEELMGEDWWSYGFNKNRHVLETFLRYHHQQGLSSRLLKPEELFAPETFEAFKI